MPHVRPIAILRDLKRPRTFYGWSVVSQAVATDNGRQVNPTPSTDNPYHADIILPVAVRSNDELYLDHLNDLAANAYWLDRCP